MPFLRFSRDKRGYEHTYLVHASIRRGKPGPSRVLYWYRTPPGVKVGRPAFDEEARARIQSLNPDVSFDWKTLEATPMPPVREAERWRERRRVERAVKQARRVEEADTLGAAGSEEFEEPIPDTPDAVAVEEFEVVVRFGEALPLADGPAVTIDIPEDPGDDTEEDAVAGEILARVSLVAPTAAEPAVSQTAAPEPRADVSDEPSAKRGRRRRRGGRRHHHGSVNPSSHPSGSSRMVQDVPGTRPLPSPPVKSGE